MGIEKPKASGSFTVLNDMGMHVRPAAAVAQSLKEYPNTTVYFRYEKGFADASSILAIMQLAIPPGGQVKIEAQGDQAQEAVQSLQKLAQQQFNAQY